MGGLLVGDFTMSANNQLIITVILLCNYLARYLSKLFFGKSQISYLGLDLWPKYHIGMQFHHFLTFNNTQLCLQGFFFLIQAVKVFTYPAGKYWQPNQQRDLLI